MVRKFHFHLDIYYNTFMQYYSAKNSSITVTTEENAQRIKLPTRYLQPFLTHIGIKGRFQVTLGAGDRVTSIVRIR